MTVVSLKCPNCGSSIIVEEGKNRCFCSNCGEQLIVDDGITRVINVHIDQAKEHELENDMTKYLKATARLDQKIAASKKSLRWKIPIMILLAALLFLGPDHIFIPGSNLSQFIAITTVCFGFYFMGSIITLGSDIEERNKLDTTKKK